MSTQLFTLPYLTFSHRPQRGYVWHSNDDTHTIYSPVFEVAVDFSSVVLSVHYAPRPNSWLLTEVQVRQAGTWSHYFKMGFYSEKLNHSFDKQTRPSGEVNVDVLHLSKPAQAYRFRLTQAGEVDVPLVTLCLTASNAAAEPFAAQLPAGTRCIAVPPISQKQLPLPPLTCNTVCSPTALCMAMQALGVEQEPLDTVTAVYDDRARIYGNWALNTAYACTRGLEACVTRFQRLAQLEDYISPDSLVLASIAYQRGELTNAAIEKTDGHLVVICGWENGKICVADPAAEDAAGVLRAYDAIEFARAWLINKRGIAYLVRKK